MRPTTAASAQAESDVLDLRASTGEAVARQLRRELLLGTIAPGSRILAKDLARRYSVSIIPVREALRQLRAEGLIASSPGGKTHATEVGLDDLRGLYDLRRLVEGDFALRAAGRRTQRDIDQVNELLAALGRQQPYSDPFFSTHRAFHWELLSPAATNVTHRVLEGIWQTVDRYVALAVGNFDGFDADEHVTSTQHEHEALAASFALGDGQALRAGLVQHLDRTEDRLQTTYAEALASEQFDWLKPPP